VSVHDGLRHPGRAGRIDDPERVRERNGRECQRRWRGDRLDERDGARRSGHVDGGPGIEVRHHHDRLDGWQLPNDLAYRLSAVERLPAIAVPIHCEEHLRFDLAEALDYALVRAMRDHPAEVPDRRPERLQLLYRPAPERVVAIEAQASLPLEPAPVAGDSGGLDPCG